MSSFNKNPLIKSDIDDTVDLGTLNRFSIKKNLSFNINGSGSFSVWGPGSEEEITLFAKNLPDGGAASWFSTVHALLRTQNNSTVTLNNQQATQLLKALKEGVDESLKLFLELRQPRIAAGSTGFGGIFGRGLSNMAKGKFVSGVGGITSTDKQMLASLSQEILDRYQIETIQVKLMTPGTPDFFPSEMLGNDLSEFPDNPRLPGRLLKGADGIMRLYVSKQVFLQMAQDSDGDQTMLVALFEKGKSIQDAGTKLFSLKYPSVRRANYIELLDSRNYNPIEGYIPQDGTNPLKDFFRVDNFANALDEKMGMPTNKFGAAYEKATRPAQAYVDLTGKSSSFANQRLSMPLLELARRDQTIRQVLYGVNQSLEDGSVAVKSILDSFPDQGDLIIEALRNVKAQQADLDPQIIGTSQVGILTNSLLTLDLFLGIKKLENGEGNIDLSDKDAVAAWIAHQANRDPMRFQTLELGSLKGGDSILTPSAVWGNLGLESSRLRDVYHTMAFRLDKLNQLSTGDLSKFIFETFNAGNGVVDMTMFKDVINEVYKSGSNAFNVVMDPILLNKQRSQVQRARQDQFFGIAKQLENSQDSLTKYKTLKSLGLIGVANITGPRLAEINGRSLKSAAVYTRRSLTGTLSAGKDASTGIKRGGSFYHMADTTILHPAFVTNAEIDLDTGEFTDRYLARLANSERAFEYLSPELLLARAMRDLKVEDVEWKTAGGSFIFNAADPNKQFKDGKQLTSGLAEQIARRFSQPDRLGEFDITDIKAYLNRPDLKDPIKAVEALTDRLLFYASNNQLDELNRITALASSSRSGGAGLFSALDELMESLSSYLGSQASVSIDPNSGIALGLSPEANNSISGQFNVVSAYPLGDERLLGRLMTSLSGTLPMKVAAKGGINGMAVRGFLGAPTLEATQKRTAKMTQGNVSLYANLRVGIILNDEAEKLLNEAGALGRHRDTVLKYIYALDDPTIQKENKAKSAAAGELFLTSAGMEEIKSEMRINSNKQWDITDSPKAQAFMRKRGIKIYEKKIWSSTAGKTKVKRFVDMRDLPVDSAMELEGMGFVNETKLTTYDGIFKQLAGFGYNAANIKSHNVSVDIDGRMEPIHLLAGGGELLDKSGGPIQLFAVLARQNGFSDEAIASILSDLAPKLQSANKVEAQEALDLALLRIGYKRSVGTSTTEDYNNNKIARKVSMLVNTNTSRIGFSMSDSEQHTNQRAKFTQKGGLQQAENMSKLADFMQHILGTTDNSNMGVLLTGVFKQAADELADENSLHVAEGIKGLSEIAAGLSAAISGKRVSISRQQAASVLGVTQNLYDQVTSTNPGADMQGLLKLNQALQDIASKAAFNPKATLAGMALVGVGSLMAQRRMDKKRLEARQR